MKKLLALILALATLFCFAACGTEAPVEEVAENTDAEGIKVGFIFLHDENSTYDKNFMVAAEAVQETLGLTNEQVLFRTQIPEGDECYKTAKELAEEGCDIIFANSFGHEPYMIKAAKEYPDVQFCHSTGTRAHTEGLDNFHNAFAHIYQGRFLAGVAAGLKLNAMIEAGEITAEEAKMGYVGAFTYEEVVSGYTSFYLGAKSVCPSVTMEVQFTGSWYDETEEKEAANKLIDNKCVLISQHADSMGAPTACENAGVPNVSYNGSTVSACPNTFIVSSRIDWTPYYKFAIEAVMNNETIPADWCGGIAEGSVVLTEVNEAAAAEGTVEKLEEVKAALADGTVKVFDIATFTVGGEAVAADFQADVDTDENYTPDTAVIIDGAFEESMFRSAPYFGLRIDGITLLNEEY